MKLILAIVVIITMSGCASYNTHLKTGCVWSCGEWEQRLAENPTMGATSGSSYTPSTGISSTQVFLPSGGYSVIRSGSTISVIQTSKSK